MSGDIKQWANRLRRLIKDMPAGIEVVVSYQHMDIHPAGTLHHHVLVLDTGYGVTKEPLESIKTERIIPYSEGS